MDANNMELAGLHQLANLLNVSRHTVARWAKLGYLPPGQRVNSRRRLWRVAQVKAWLDERWPVEKPLYARPGAGGRAVPVQTLDEVPAGWEWAREGSGQWQRR